MKEIGKALLALVEFVFYGVAIFAIALALVLMWIKLCEVLFY